MNVVAKDKDNIHQTQTSVTAHGSKKQQLLKQTIAAVLFEVAAPQTIPLQ